MMSLRTGKIVIAALLVGLVAWACGSPNPQPSGLTPIPSLAPGATPTLLPQLQTPPSGPSSTAGPSGGANAAVGASYFARHCAVCHGNQGQGVDAPALRNNPVVQAGDQSLHSLIANGVPSTEMPAWLQGNGGPLTDADISSIVDFLHTLQGVSPLPSPTAAPPEPTETPLPPGAPTPVPAAPSESGGPGPAASMTGNAANGQPDFGQYCASCHGAEGVVGRCNPGSDDGTVPPLSPIDPTLVNSNPSIFAVNVDLFIEHGSVPEGSDPLIVMPSFGDSKMLTAQQIADMIAYVMKLNGVSAGQ